ncbi:Uncharacterised protein [Serratia fonticola]|uniref:hypothetical protein n=1 Tax=Serratia fonticola TaxID=47917 RepID=UPI002177F171|nr:hypothetical protein [Serratia fonticola]CAI1818719.1 Uncharacterised protein [Serratia fonticola]
MIVAKSHFESEFNDLLKNGECPSKETFESIQRFTLSFSLFEAKLLKCDGSQGESKNYASLFLSKELVDIKELDRVFEYFAERYARNGDSTQRYSILCGDRGGKLQPVVAKTFSSQEQNSEDRLTACLYVLFRLRNNLFHGPKWLGNMDKQVPNLNAASDLILNILRISREKHFWTESD